MRLIDADEFILSLNNYIDKPMTAGLCTTLITLFPTAYDIDKVVEKLEEKKIRHIMLADYENKCGTIVERQEHLKAIEALNETIEIVKQGLKEQK